MQGMFRCLRKWTAVACALLILLAQIPAPGESVRDGIYDVSPILCNPAPSEEAQALMNWLCEMYGSKIISGQYLDEWQYGGELSAIAAVTEGLYPGLLGLDLMNYSPASVSLGTHGVSVSQALDYWKQGYIITLCWHWIAPEKYLDTSGNNWWGGFYTQNTSFDLAKALSGEDPEGRQLLIRDMDAIAAQLAVLRDAGVPVLWRPLHEASGGWFWWGASGAQAYKELYRMMYERFTAVHGLNNLIWVWNGQSADWYPGDEMVDIIGEDVYPGKHVHDIQAGAFRRCLGYTSAKKLIMLSECGCIPSPIRCGKDGVMWSAWCVWCYEFVLKDGKYSEDYTTAELLKRFYELDNVLTLKDVPAFGREAQTREKSAEGLNFAFADAALRGMVSVSGEWVEMRGNAPSDGLTLTIDVPQSGTYRLMVLQAGIGGYKENYLSVDGQALDNLTVQGSEAEDCFAGKIYLEAGRHEVDITAFWGWVKLKRLALIPEEVSE